MCWRRMWCEGGDKKAGRAARGVADALARLRIHERNDQVDDVARGAELAVRAGRGRACESRYSYMSPLKSWPSWAAKSISWIALNDGAERGAVVDFERGAAERSLPVSDQSGKFVEAFDGVADGIEELVAGERDEVAPGDTATICRKKCGRIFCRGSRESHPFQ